MQHQSGARIQVTRDADSDPRAATRQVELMGTTEQINRAEQLIKDVIAEVCGELSSLPPFLVNTSFEEGVLGDGFMQTA